MAVTLKPLNQQVIVLTGATSGIGLATARQAAAQGAKLVLGARSEGDLRTLEQEIRAAGGEVAVVPMDVAKAEDIRRLAETALKQFGRIDTWINDAGVSIVGRLVEVKDEDSRKLFETNFWGTVNGSLEAAKHLRETGGALINLGSLASDRAFPLEGMYVASKHAIKGFTDTLRMELEEAGAPISVTLIKPAAINTPFAEHTKKYIAEEPSLPPPVYPVQEVVNAILHAATHPVRDIFVGGASRAMSTGGRVAPRMTDRFMEKTMFKAHKRDEPARDIEGALHSARGGLEEEGTHPGHVAKFSLYTRAALHPWISGLVVGAAGAAIVGTLALNKARKADF